MAWQDTLIRLYLYICHHYQGHLWVLAQRLSNNDQPQFTDEEVLTIYLFGIVRKHRTIQDIYDYTEALQNLRYCASAHNAGVFEGALSSMRPERPPKTPPSAALKPATLFKRYPMPMLVSA